MEGLGDKRLRVTQGAQHVDILRSLTGEEESHFAGLAASAVDAVQAKHLPAGSGVRLQRLERFGGARQQFGLVFEINHQAFRFGDFLWSRANLRRQLSGLGLADSLLQQAAQFGDGLCAEEEQTVIGLEGGSFRDGQADGRGGGGGADLGDGRRDGEDPLAGQRARAVFLQHQVEIRPAEAKSADAGAAYLPGTHVPGARLRVDVKGAVGKINLRVGFLEIDRGRQLVGMERQDSLEHPGGPGGALEVADIGFDRTERHAPRTETQRAEDGVQAAHLDHVAHSGGGAVPLDETDRFRGDAGVLPGALDGALLADRIGRGDAFAFAVTAGAEAADDGVDFVAVAFGIHQTFEQEDRRSLAHDEAVGAIGVGARTVRAESADLAELDERFGPHVAIHAAGQDGVELAEAQAVHCRLQRRQRRGAGRVGDEIWPGEVEHVGHPSGDDVGEFARHGVFRDLREARMYAAGHALNQGRLHLRRKPLEGRQGGEDVQVFGQVDADGGEVMVLSGHGVAQHHRHPFRVEMPFRVAVIFERLVRGNDRPLLRLVNQHLALGRDGNPHLHRFELEAAHPAADLAVSLVGRGRVGVVEKFGLPAFGRQVGD